MWQSTRPQTPGVYTASTERNADARRLFTGRRWSAPWYVGDPPHVVDLARATPARLQRGDRVEWQHAQG